MKKAKRRKAPGPDEIPLDFFKELSEDNLQKIVDQLNEWWDENTDIPDDMLRARIFLLLKDGSTRNIENYRPIALLNTITKMFAHVLKVRIAEQIDKHLHKTQFGFRK